MTARYEVHPSHDGLFYWHKRAANGEVTSVSEVFTRHEDAVRAIRTDVELAAEILEISESSFEKLYRPHLVYYTAKGLTTETDYEEAPLYPVAAEVEA